MKKAIKRIAGRILIIILVILAIYLFISNIGLLRDLVHREKIYVVIDADAANGPDDPLSILRILKAENVEVRGLFSAQWRLADLDNDSTVGSNLEVHRFLLHHFQLTHIPHPGGAALPLFYTGAKAARTGPAISQPGKNQASGAIIKIAQEIPRSEKLNLLCLGSATNLASALLSQPEISGRIICYIQGPRYEPTRRTWNKNDPVTRLDLEAMDVLLNDNDLEIHLLPANISRDMVLDKSRFMEEFAGKDTLLTFIREHIMASSTGTDSIHCPSLALVEAFLNPDLATGNKLIAPPENTQRKIYVYTRIDAERMAKDFLKSIRKQ
jgi:purine nucleosidase